MRQKADKHTGASPGGDYVIVKWSNINMPFSLLQSWTTFIAQYPTVGLGLHPGGLRSEIREFILMQWWIRRNYKKTLIIFLFPTFAPHACIPRERISGSSMMIIRISCTKWLGTVLDSSLSRVGADGTRPNLSPNIASVSRNKHFGQIPIGRFSEE